MGDLVVRKSVLLGFPEKGYVFGRKIDHNEQPEGSLGTVPTIVNEDQVRLFHPAHGHLFQRLSEISFPVLVDLFDWSCHRSSIG